MTRVLAWTCVALTACLLGAGLLVQHLRAENRESQLDARNARAMAAVSRRGLVTYRGETRAIVQRLTEEHAVETSALQDSLQKVAGAEAVANARVRVLEGRLSRQQEAAATVRDTAGLVVTDTLDALDSLGIRADVAVTVPADTTRPTVVQWGILRAPADLELTLSCLRQNAEATLTGPSWLETDLVRVQQDDRICVPPVRTWHPFSLDLPGGPVAVLLVGAGMLIERIVHILGGA